MLLWLPTHRQLLYRLLNDRQADSMHLAPRTERHENSEQCASRNWMKGLSVPSPLTGHPALWRFRGEDGSGIIEPIRENNQAKCFAGGAGEILTPSQLSSEQVLVERDMAAARPPVLGRCFGSSGLVEDPTPSRGHRFHSSRGAPLRWPLVVR